MKILTRLLDVLAPFAVLLMFIAIIFGSACSTGGKEADPVATMNVKAIDALHDSMNTQIEQSAADTRDMFAKEVELRGLIELARINLIEDPAARDAEHTALMKAQTAALKANEARVAANMKKFRNDPNWRTAEKCAAALKAYTAALANIDSNFTALVDLIMRKDATTETLP